MAETVLFTEQTVSGFAANAEFGGFYTANVIFGDTFDSFTIIQGETYKVLWDGTWYTVVAQDASAIIEGCLFLGNGSMYGLSGNDEPFAIGWGELGVTFFSLTETVDTHTVAIHLVESGIIQTQSSVILKDRDGNDVTYANANGDVPTIKLDTPDGGTQTYIKGEMKEATIALDFSDGDMDVIPDAGKLFSKVSIPKPANLAPENIPKGITIAGVKGGLTVGGEVNINDKPIRFYDPYGNVIYGYTREEIQELTSLPEGPTLPGLDFETWTHTLSELKNEKYFTDVGPMYMRKSTDTLHPSSRVHVAIVETLTDDETVSFCFYGKKCSVVINWGDGTTEEVTGFSTGSSQNNVNKSHAFSKAGLYVISISFTATGGSCTMGYNITSYHYNIHCRNIPNGSTAVGVAQASKSDYQVISLLFNSVLYGLYSLSYVNLHSLYRLKFMAQRSCSSATSRRLFNCHSLKAIAGVAMNGVGNNMFRCTNTIERLKVSSTVSENSFIGCNSMKEILFGSGAISDNNMNSKWAMLMTSTTPPTISATAPQWGTYPIYVPDEAVETYKAASGWSNAAAYILPASQYPD